MAVVSGKGGTGKTTLVASFATLAGSVVVADCDVDAADLHLLLDPQVISKQEFKGSKLAIIDEDRCTECKLCEDACRFNAIKDLKVDAILCEGCGVCAYLCLEDAISLIERVSGYTYVSKTRFGPMAHAKLNAAEANSGKLVTLLRHNARQLAENGNYGFILIDGPPGIGCPVIASLTGVDLTVIVTEPTMSGLHDLRRILDVVHHFGSTPLVIINVYDISLGNTEKIVEFCRENGVKVLGKIPFDLIVTEAMVAGKTVVEYSPNCVASKKIHRVWDDLQSILEKGDSNAGIDI
ncbi:MAG: nucleotide-binding protein [Nitrososphaerales archaeon]